jgi:hypothetical protein
MGQTIIERVRRASDTCDIAARRADEKRRDRNTLIRQALSEGYSVSLLARTTGLTRAGIRQVRSSDASDGGAA